RNARRTAGWLLGKLVPLGWSMSNREEARERYGRGRRTTRFRICPSDHMAAAAPSASKASLLLPVRDRESAPPTDAQIEPSSVTHLNKASANSPRSQFRTWNSWRSNVRPLPRPEAMAIATAVAPSPADHRRLFTPPKPIGLARAFRHHMSSFGASVHGEGNDGAARTGPAATPDVDAVRRGSAAITGGRPATGRRATAEGPAAPAPG